MSCCGNKETCGDGGNGQRRLPPSAKQTSSSPSTSGQEDGLDGAGRIRVEFAVNISNQRDLERVEAALKLKGVDLVSSDIGEKTIQFDLPVVPSPDSGGDAATTRVTGGRDSSLDHASPLQSFIEEQTGLLTVVKGLGRLNSAVAELRPAPQPPAGKIAGQDQVMGAVRLSQLADSKCYADVSLYGLDGGGLGGRRRHYSLAIHEFGDLAGDGYENIGRPMVPIQDMLVGQEGGAATSGVSRSLFLENCNVASMIGRSIALSESLGAGEKHSDKRQVVVLSAGVIARASTVGANRKQICSCSGKTLWEERMDSKQESHKLSRNSGGDK